VQKLALNHCGRYGRPACGTDKPGDASEVAAFGDLLDGEVELVAGDEIELLAGLPMNRPASTATLAPIMPTLRPGLAFFSARTVFTSDEERRRSRCAAHEVAILDLRQHVGERQPVGGGAVDQLGVLNHGGGLRQPGRGTRMT